MRKSDSSEWGLSSWNCGPRALSGVLAPSGGPAPHAVAASDDVGEERGATGDRGYCKDSKRSACPEARVFPVSSVITSGAPWAHWPRMVSVVVVFADEPGCSREMGLGSLTLTGTVVPCAPRSPNACWAVVGGVWVSIAGVLVEGRPQGPP